MLLKPWTCAHDEVSSTVAPKLSSYLVTELKLQCILHIPKTPITSHFSVKQSLSLNTSIYFFICVVLISKHQMSINEFSMSFHFADGVMKGKKSQEILVPFAVTYSRGRQFVDIPEEKSQPHQPALREVEQNPARIPALFTSVHANALTSRSRELDECFWITRSRTTRTWRRSRHIAGREEPERQKGTGWVSHLLTKQSCSCPTD